MPKKLNEEHYKILDLLKTHAAEGISQVAIEKALRLDHSQTDRRRRDLNSHYVIEARYVKEKGEWRHFYLGEKEVPLDDEPISQKWNAEAMNKARGRCPMCGPPQKDRIARTEKRRSYLDLLR